MHIENNVSDKMFNSVIDIKDKTKDNAKVMIDFKEYCCRKDLKLVKKG